MNKKTIQQLNAKLENIKLKLNLTDDNVYFLISITL